jgi:hypothetical protein
VLTLSILFKMTLLDATFSNAIVYHVWYLQAELWHRDFLKDADGSRDIQTEVVGLLPLDDGFWRLCKLGLQDGKSPRVSP